MLEDEDEEVAPVDEVDYATCVLDYTSMDVLDINHEDIDDEDEGIN